MRGEVLGQRQASPRPAPLPGFYHLPPRAGSAIIDSVFAGAPPEEIEQLCAFLLGEPCGPPLALPACSLQPAARRLCSGAQIVWCAREADGSCWQNQHIRNPGRGHSLPPLHKSDRERAVSNQPAHSHLTWPSPTRNLTADGDDGAPLQAGKPPSSAQPALSCAVAPTRGQRSPLAAQPQTPFSAIAASAWPAHVSPFAFATTPAPQFTPPHSTSGSGGPPPPAHTGDRALSWLVNWCARAEAEGIECLPPPSQSSWQELVASGSLSGTLTQR